MDKISEATVRQLLQPVLRTSSSNLSIERIAEGGDHAAWYVGDDMVLRLRIHESNSDDDFDLQVAKREVKIRNIINGLFGNQGYHSMIPECLEFRPLAGNYDSYGRMSFTLDRRVGGISLEHADAKVTQKTVDGLLWLMQTLRKAPLESLDDVPRLNISNAEEMFNDTRKSWARLVEKGQLDSAFLDEMLIEYNITKLLRHMHTDSASENDGLVLLHADFKGEHIFIDPEDGRLLGVIDWADAAIGHPAIDINGLAISVGSHRAADIARLAGYDIPVITRGIFLARCETILRLDDRLNGEDPDSPVSLLYAQMKRAFEDVGLI